MNLLVKKFNQDAQLPSYGSDFAAGLDLYALGNYTVPGGERVIISTGISVEYNGPESKEYYLRIAPRSGLSAKHSIDIGAGVVDWDYRGEIFVCFINNGNKDYCVKSGDRVAQLIPERITRFAQIIEVDSHNNTSRGVGGFGSTGI